MSTAQDLPVPYGEPAASAPALRLVPTEPLNFDEAVRHIRPRLHRYAIRRLGDLHEAEELVQEALLRAYSHRAQLLTEDDLAAWATVVTGRLVIDRLRVRGRSTTMADVPENSRTARDTADVVVARDEARLALDALDAMPARQAALLWAREVEGQSYDELCARFAMTEPAVRSVLTRARKALRKEYSARGGTLPAGGLAVLAPWVAGLSVADRLRKAATRITAPAALSAVGITALGGLVLNPFTFLPGAQRPAFHPTPAVVAVRQAEPVLHPVAAVSAARTEGTETARPSHAATSSGLHSSLRTLGRAVERCVNDNGRGGSSAAVEAGPVLADPTAGSTTCSAATHVHRSSLMLSPALPDNPTGVHQVVVSSDYLPCQSLPSSAAYTCTGAPSTQEH